MRLAYIPKSEFARVNQTNIDWEKKAELVAKMARLNTLFEVKRAGSGHLGSSFSAMDIVVYLYYRRLNVTKVGVDSPDRDIYFSSKGHDAPGLYAVLNSLGIVSDEKLLSLRRLGGLDGHPDVGINGVEANTGSLGMGISKGRGMLFAKKHFGHKGRVYVMVGDGEFQEGENFEALQSTVQQQANELVVIMDHNKLQSDRYVDRINSLGDLEKKIAAFGWHVARCNGHDYAKLEETLDGLEALTDKPKFVICDTIKGCGISFMEHPVALEANNGFYKWHSGAPDDASYQKAWEELYDGVTKLYAQYSLGAEVPLITPEPEKRPATKVSKEFLCDAYGQALVELGHERSDLVVLDADLSLDCRLRTFEDTFPKRFIEMGIAEQDMVSMAGGLALQGLLPITHSFANFLAARANEQIYNTQTEKRKVIYSCHYAGLIPAGPGKSHQAVRDISLFSTFPTVTILQACSASEMKQVLRYAVNDCKESVMIRVNIGPSPREISLPGHYQLSYGKGIALTEPSDTVLFTYGPVMVNEALLAYEHLKARNKNITVVNMPWLNRFDSAWLEQILQGVKTVGVLEDHSPVGGLGDHLLAEFNRLGWSGKFKFGVFGVEGIPACGTPWEALRFHRLDGETVASRLETLGE
jgi:transketolase